MGDENKYESTGSVVTDCFLTWVELLELKEKKGRAGNDEVKNRH
ncbi:hypothetical protein JCM14467A_11720 [Vulcanisaeta sp. JCM 14467]